MATWQVDLYGEVVQSTNVGLCVKLSKVGVCAHFRILPPEDSASGTSAAACMLHTTNMQPTHLVREGTSDSDAGPIVVIQMHHQGRAAGVQTVTRPNWTACGPLKQTIGTVGTAVSHSSVPWPAWRVCRR